MQKSISEEFYRPGILALCALVALWFLFLRNAVDGSTSFALFIDNEFLLGPMLASMSETLRAGEWPLRMDTILGGFPLYNLTQFSAFYPFYLLPLRLFETPAQAIAGMHMLTLGHLLIMEINTYVFLRVAGASRLAALTAAALIAFSANSFSYAVWVNIVAPYAWFPLFLAGLVGLSREPHLRRYSAMTVGGIAMLTFASPAQPLIHAIFTAGIFFAAIAIVRRMHGDFRELVAFSGHLTVVALLSILLVAPVLIPAAFEFDNMIRWIGDFPALYGNSRIPFAAFTSEQLSAADLGGVLYKFKGGAIGQQFVGVIVLSLALIALVSRLRSWLVCALTFIAAWSLLSAAGSNLGLAWLNYWIPLINKIREPTRFLFLFQFAICALAAFGLDEIRQIAANEPGKNLTRRHLLAGVVIIVLALLTLIILRERIISVIPPLASIAMLVVLFMFTWLSPRQPFDVPPSLVTGAWSIVALVSLSQEVSWTPPPTSYSHYLTANLAPLDSAIARVAELDPAREYRLIFDGTIDKQVAGMLASSHGVRTLNAYVNPAPRQLFEELYYHGPRNDNYVRVLGARYLLCKECSTEAIADYQYVEAVAGYDLYETADVLPYSYISQHISGSFSNLGDFTEKASLFPLNERFLFVETQQLPVLQHRAGTGFAAAACSSMQTMRLSNKVRVAVQCQSSAFLVLNEFYDGNWSARIDGSSAKLLKVNGNQMAVAVPAGRHQVEFRYRPVIFQISLGLFATGVVLSLYLLLRWPFRKQASGAVR